MKAHIRYLGIVDRNGETHSVAFKPGVNVVTGRSSTGKSALIEIFDFCFGSSEFTIPEGIITQRADLYFCILSLRETNLILARRRDGKKVHLREKAELTFTEPLQLPPDFFDDAFFIPLDSFKVELGRYLGVLVTNPEEDPTAKEWRGNRKASAPSVRSLTSFMLQHQNLVANKHAIFYRFDEGVKREQVIEHFKIFAGFADQEYFTRSQRLAELSTEQRRLEVMIPRAAEVRQVAAVQITEAMLEFLTMSGNALDLGSPDAIVRNPAVALEKLRQSPVQVMAASDEHIRQKRLIEGELSQLTADLRKAHNKLAEINSSIEFATLYDKGNRAMPLPPEAEITAAQCPFCRSPHTAVELEANKLLGAIDWLNQELERSPYLLESFLDQQRKIQAEATRLHTEIRRRELSIARIDQQTTELEQRKGQYELALRAKYRVESILTEMIGGRNAALEEQLEKVKSDAAKIRHFLKANYDIDAKFAVAENTIREFMAEIAAKFEFEASYKPVRLSFSLSTFDLWHDSPERKIYLRSMGSGANWLYSHVTLFLALHRYFCRLGARCSIPSILFLDQPSQVYFPTVLDNGTRFAPEELAEKDATRGSRPVDDDLLAVSNLYDQLVTFCEATLAESGIMPQIIVTDHADHLKLRGEKSFEDLVRSRWRTRGFVAEVSSPVQSTMPATSPSD